MPKVKQTAKKPIYIVQEHNAKKAGLHWDLRLQAIGDEGKSVLFSWAIPKGIPEHPGTKRLALRMPDHALSWASFEGRITDGYGEGTVKLWDKGSYIPLKLGKGIMLFEIFGKRLKGIWKLSMMAGSSTKWLIEKLDITREEIEQDA
jgi:bifunctional non-homologous end joining protein LigD